MTIPADTRAAAVAGIRVAAEVRAALGQAGHHELLPGGQHKVALFDRAAGKLRGGVGATVAAAVANAREEPRV
jgi:hypothetical protein